MEAISKILLGIHVACGFASLVLFWLPILTRKGGKAHVIIGKIYVALMWVVVVTAILLCIKNSIIGNYQSAALLGFLSVITASPLWEGIAVLKQKKSVSESFYSSKYLLSIIMFIAGLALTIFGIYLQGEDASILMLIFGILGTVNGWQGISQYRNRQKGQVNWYLDHLSGMIVSGIAAHTAFFAFGGRSIFGNLMDGPLMVIPWVMPTIIGVAIIKYMKKKHLEGKRTV